MEQKELLFSLFKAELRDETVLLPKEEVTPDDLLTLYQIAKDHDLAHMLGAALSRTDLLEMTPEIGEKLTKGQMLALYRYERLNFEYSRICALFEKEQIPYVPLKGAVLRQYYPKPYMRTSCDIDVLIKEEDIERALLVLTEQLSYKADGGKTFHDVHVYSPGGVHLELHYNIKEDIEPMDRVLLQVFDHLEKAEGSEYRYLQTPEYLYFHQIAHAAYHFIKGGCGIRPVMDLYLLKKHLPYEKERLEALLEKAELQTFARALFLLSEVWFGEEQHTPLTLEMESYILGAGVYGTVENSVAMGRAVKKGKVSYILGHVFMPYGKLKGRFPILEKHPLLFPFVSVYRWLRILFGKHHDLAISVFKTNAALSEDKKDRLAALRNNLKLK